MRDSRRLGVLSPPGEPGERPDSEGRAGHPGSPATDPAGHEAAGRPALDGRERARCAVARIWLCLMGTALTGAACNGPLVSVASDRPEVAGQESSRRLAGPTAQPQATDGGDWALSGPDSGEVRRAATFRVTLAEGVHPAKPVRFTPSASDGDGTFAPASAELSDSTRSATIEYTPTRWGRRTIAMADDGGLRDPGSMLEFVAKVQLGSSGTAPSGNRGPDLGGFDFFARGAWWQELGRRVDDDPVAPDSDALLAGFGAGKIKVDWDTTTTRGGGSLFGMPYNVVPGDQPQLPITLGVFAKESDPGPVPFFRSMTIERWAEPNAGPPTPAYVKIKGDHHALVAQRDEVTGGIDRLYEYYLVGSEDGGATWKALAGGAQFDLRTGAPRPEFWTSGDAAGLPIFPLLVRYDEAARGEIKHPLRVAISSQFSRNRFVWPARHAVYSGSHKKGLPMGARLRLKRSWYEANRADYGPIGGAIVDAMRHYGVIVADLAVGGIWLCGVNDERWDHAELMRLRALPDSAFEVLDTIGPPFRFTGPDRGPAMAPSRFRIEHLVPRDSHFSTGLFIQTSTDGGKTWPSRGVQPALFKCDDRHRGPYDFTFTPPAPGTYTMRVLYGGQPWIEPPEIVFTATAGAAPRRSRSGGGADAGARPIPPRSPGAPSRPR